MYFVFFSNSKGVLNCIVDGLSPATKMSFNNITAFPDNLFYSPQLHRLNLFSENKQIGEFIVNWSDYEQEF